MSQIILAKPSATNQSWQTVNRETTQRLLGAGRSGTVLPEAGRWQRKNRLFARSAIKVKNIAVARSIARSARDNLTSAFARMGCIIVRTAGRLATWL